MRVRAMQVERIANTEGFCKLARHWPQQELLGPMQSFEWMSSWWHAYQRFENRKRELCLLAVRDASGDLIGIAPFYKQSQGYRMETLRLLGDGEVCSDHCSILSSKGQKQNVVLAVADWLKDNASSYWNQIVLESIDADDASIGSLIGALSQTHPLLETRTEEGSCFVNLPNSWDDYLASLSRNHRKRCRRLWRSFFDSQRASFCLAQTQADLDDYWPILEEFHNARRHELGETGAFESHEFVNFHRDVTTQLLEQGRLRLQILEVDHQPCAVEYALVDDNCVYAYQSGLSKYGQELGAGTLSLMAMIRDSIERGCKRFDFLRGQEEYKRHWGIEVCPAKTITIRDRSIIGLANHCMSTFYQSLKKARRSWLDRKVAVT